LMYTSKEKTDEPVRLPLSYSMVTDHPLKPNGVEVVAFAGGGRIAPAPVRHAFNWDHEDDKAEWKSALASVSQTTDDVELFSSMSSVGGSLEDYEVIKILAKSRGGSKVALAKMRSDGTEVDLDLVKPRFTLSKLPPPSRPVIPFAPVWLRTFATEDRTITVQSHTDLGGLYERLSAERVFSEENARFYGAEIVLFIKSCHEAVIRLPGFRMESIGLGPDGHIVVHDTMLQNGGGGQFEYIAPETLSDSWSRESSDWWRFGVVMYEMLCGRLPFYNKDPAVLAELISTEPLKFPSRLSPVAKQFLGDLLAKDPTTRLGSGTEGSQSVMDHEFFQSINWDDAAKRGLQPPFVPESSAPASSDDAADPFALPDE